MLLRILELVLKELDTGGNFLPFFNRIGYHLWKLYHSIPQYKGVYHDTFVLTAVYRRYCVCIFISLNFDCQQCFAGKCCLCLVHYFI